MCLFIVSGGNNILSNKFRAKTKFNNVTSCTMQFFCKYVLNDVCNIIYVNSTITQESFERRITQKCQ